MGRTRRYDDSIQCIHEETCKQNVDDTSRCGGILRVLWQR